MIVRNAYKDVELIVMVKSDDRISISNKRIKWVLHLVMKKNVQNNVIIYS